MLPVVKVWVTKYALSAGVFVKSGQVANDREMIRLNNDSGYGHHFIHKGEYATSEAAAVEQVRKQAAAKLRSLDKSRAKVEAVLAGLDRGELPMAKGATPDA